MLAAASSSDRSSRLTGIDKTGTVTLAILNDSAVTIPLVFSVKDVEELEFVEKQQLA